MTTRAEAFAAQAAADLEAYNMLVKSSLPTSHRLHYLQMWLEKLCKAYIWLPSSSSDDLRMKHNVVAKVLPQIIRQYWRRIGFERRPEINTIRQLCREVDLLHPQVDDNGRRPDNVEYPWTSSDGTAQVPARWSFNLGRRLFSHPGKLLLKAAAALTRNPAVFNQ